MTNYANKLNLAYYWYECILHYHNGPKIAGTIITTKRDILIEWDIIISQYQRDIS